MKRLVFASESMKGGNRLWDSPFEHYWWMIARHIRDHLNAESSVYFALENQG